MVKNKMKTQKDFEDVLLAFHHKMADELHKEALRLKFTTSQLEVLRYVAEMGSPTMKDIAKHLHITPPSVTVIIEQLCKIQLLKREFDVKDRRIVKIVLAPKSYKLFLKLKNKKFVILNSLFSKLNIDDKKELMRILSLLTL